MSKPYASQAEAWNDALEKAAQIVERYNASFSDPECRYAPGDIRALKRDAAEAPVRADMVERVARAINAVSCLAPVTEVARAALEASDHAELTLELSELRCAVGKFQRRMNVDEQTDTDFALIARSLMEDLSKIGGDA